MSSKPKQLKRPTPIDPIFRVPTGAEDEFTLTEDDNSIEYIFNNAGLTAVNTPFGVLYQNGSTTTPDGGILYLPAPANLAVYDQKVRRANGVVLVDIIAQFEDVKNADRYELRVTKV